MLLEKLKTARQNLAKMENVSKTNLENTNLGECVTTSVDPLFNILNSCSTLDVPTEEQKEESMDILHPEEDTSGGNISKSDIFLEKYANGDDTIQILRTDLMSILSDIHWIKESNNENSQWALDFADALNELSVSI